MRDNLVKNIWKEELRSSREILEIKMKRLTDLPKGSIQPRNRRNGIYYYLFYRDGKKVKSAYLGNDAEKKDRYASSLHRENPSNNQSSAQKRTFDCLKRQCS